MKTYVVLLRGINVGGKNIVPMAGLKKFLEDHGCTNVVTYIASGNVILKSEKNPRALKAQIEQALPKTFKLHSELVKVLILTRNQIKAVIDHKPIGFGDHPNKYHSDVIFLMDTTSAQALKAFNPREGVDTIWPSRGVIYSQRLSAKRTQSRLNKVMGSPLYKSMTIRNWNTTLKLFALANQHD